MSAKKNKEVKEKKDAEKNKGGRPKKEFDWEKLNRLMRFRPTDKDCEVIMGLSRMTIERAIKAEHGMTFGEYRNWMMGEMRNQLANKQFEVAMKGNVTMLIWLGKQYLGQSDKTETTEVELPKRSFAFPDPKEND